MNLQLRVLTGGIDAATTGPAAEAPGAARWDNETKDVLVGRRKIGKADTEAEAIALAKAYKPPTPLSPAGEDAEKGAAMGAGGIVGSATATPNRSSPSYVEPAVGMGGLLRAAATPAREAADFSRDVREMTPLAFMEKYRDKVGRMSLADRNLYNNKIKQAQ